MFLKASTLLTMFMYLSVSATVLEVNGFKSQYRLDYDMHKVLLKGHLISYSISEKNCNKHILESFNHRIGQALQTMPYKLNLEQGDIRFELNNKTFYAARNSKVGKLLNSIPSEVRRMKIEEKLSCKKK